MELNMDCLGDFDGVCESSEVMPMSLEELIRID